MLRRRKTITGTGTLLNQDLSVVPLPHTKPMCMLVCCTAESLHLCVQHRGHCILVLLDGDGMGRFAALQGSEGGRGHTTARIQFKAVYKSTINDG